jgi:hypothetical protein
MNNIDNVFNVGDVIKDTEAFGRVIVKDIFISTTNPNWFCYRVEDTKNPFTSYLTNEEELLTGTVL